MNKNPDINIKLLVHGDKKVWDNFVELYSPVIYSAVLKVFNTHTKIVDKLNVKDAVQEVFIRLIKDNYRLLKTYNPSKASLTIWLTIVSRSSAIDFLRRQKPDSVSLEKEIEDIPVSDDYPNSSIEIPPDLLSPRQKLILSLLFDKEMEPSEIAELLNIDVQTVRSAKHKALKKVRKFFKDGKLEW